jgi:hypothetical protein
MTTDDARKINELYSRIDTLEAENKVLKEQLSHVNDDVVVRLDALKDEVCKCYEEKV